MAPNGRSNIHDDAYRSDVNRDLFTNFAGGHLFYLDDRDRAVIPTTTRHVLIVAERGDAFAQEADLDLTSAVGPPTRSSRPCPTSTGASGSPRRPASWGPSTLREARRARSTCARASATRSRSGPTASMS
jgi:hypothetical protein